jgi:peptidoglycan/xylan/chitin deacetylase (PgdA/CDA1 family)
MQVRRNIMIELFIRNDDVYSEEVNLSRLITIGLKLRVPISFGVIPSRLTKNVENILASVKRSHPELIEIHQHGWAHINHEGKTGKAEFGAARSYHQQRDDLQSGRVILEQSFGDGFFPALSPPWNVYTADTIRAMRELGFLVLSAGPDYLGGSGQGVQLYPTKLDLTNWDDGGRLEPMRAIFTYFLAQPKNLPRTLGLLLHHRTMRPKAFDFLELALRRLSETGQVLFHSFESLEMKRMRALCELDLRRTENAVGR